MKKSIFFILLILVLLSCSNDNNNEPIDRDPVYNDFPSYFEIPPQGGTFSLRQSSNYDYEIYSCSAISARKKSDKEGDVAFFEEKVQKHETTLVGTDGKKHTYIDQYFCNWFEIKKVNVQEISLTVSPNQTGHGRDIYLTIWTISHEGMPTPIWIEQKSE